MSKHLHPDAPAPTEATRPLARHAARELTPAEVEAIAGGRKYDHTHATGPNGDDPADPGV